MNFLDWLLEDRGVFGGHFNSIVLLLSIGLFTVLRMALSVSRKSSLRLPLLLIIFGVCTIFLHKLFKLSQLLQEGNTVLLLTAKTLLLIALSRLVGLLVMELLLGKVLKWTLSRITQDILQALLYIGVVLLMLRVANVDLSSLVVSSAIISAVVGLSLQDTLGNLAAGLALQAQRPFEIGDWIQIDGHQPIGEVTEINWRATKMITLDRVEVIVPNGSMSKNSILNYSKPTRVVRRNIYVMAPYHIPPRKVHEIILQTLSSTPDILSDPTPSVVTNRFTENGLIEYWVRIFTTAFDRRDVVDGRARDRIWYALERAKLDYPYPTSKIQLQNLEQLEVAASRDREIENISRYLNEVHFLRSLSDEELKRLASQIHKRVYSPGETIIREGDKGSELFIVSKGEVVVTVMDQEVSRMHAGSFFGEMSLLTGERRSASVTAIGEAEMLVIDHELFREILKSNPSLCQEMSKTLAKRQMELEQLKESWEESAELEDRSTQILSKIKDFFAI